MEEDSRSGLMDHSMRVFGKIAKLMEKAD